MQIQDIVCQINLGTMYQKVYVRESANSIIEHKIALEDLPDFLLNSSINNIYISGVPKSFGESIERKTRKLQLEKYEKDTKNFYYI